ncbi:VOC family protein [Streptomyces armeniacus]|uniref:VOC family protein n=1 Tax=Streptomyces armeniacus TaxID=83291 RepID=A0A345XJC6_9ACTN|nr:VOC family protein [Streptomyces armeniacus]AXK31742.1 VOC family protein [Streptomyces armeniacus]
MLTTRFVPGAPIWLDLGAHDIEAAAGFYSRLFGWEFASQGAEAGGYGLFQLDGKTVAAVGPLTEDAVEPSWDLYFHTDDADATTTAVEQAGGSVRFAPFDVFALGRMAGFTDPTGADFSVWQPGKNRGLDAVNDPNTLCWTELYTSDAAEARLFYSSVFRWDFEDTLMGDDVTYTVVSPSGGGQAAAHGGILQLPEENLAVGTPSHWHPYFEVRDCDATVAEATAQGAEVTIPAMDMEGVGRMAMFTDPGGAPFAVITSVEPTG